jgi:hypothetical protein
MKIEDASIAELQKELDRKRMLEHNEKQNTLPDDFLPYKEVDSVASDSLSDNHTFLVKVFDGCEGGEFLVTVPYEFGEYCPVDEEHIEKVVKRYILTEWGTQANIEKIVVEEYFRYYGRILEVDATSIME